MGDNWENTAIIIVKEQIINSKQIITNFLYFFILLVEEIARRTY